MKRLLTILSVLSIVLTSCHVEPRADAVITPNPAYIGEDIYFNNYSVNTEYVEWDFGDGMMTNTFSPVHYYENPGFYNVTLKAFGKKSGVDVLTYEVEVIGSSVKIVVQEWYDEYYVTGASVILYPTYQDWLDQKNGTEELFTNSYGEVIFEGLRFQRYYVDVWEQNHDNYTLAGEPDGIKYIETQLLDPSFDNTFVAWVDYYPPSGLKSATRTTRDRNVVIEKGEVKNREFKNNKISVPKK